jgi:hypothetical protein
MALQITVLSDEPFTVDLDESISEAWLLQEQRLAYAGTRISLQERLAMCMTMSMLQCLDEDLNPPTQAQLVYATDIARELGVSLPFEALRYRGAMSDFIGRYVETFRHLRRARSRHNQA